MVCTYRKRSASVERVIASVQAIGEASHGYVSRCKMWVAVHQAVHVMAESRIANLFGRGILREYERPWVHQAVDKSVRGLCTAHCCPGGGNQAVVKSVRGSCTAHCCPGGGVGHLRPEK